MALEQEYDYYKANKAAWISEGREGQFVVIHARALVGFYPDANAALAAGYDRFGVDEPFLTHELRANEPPLLISRRAVHAFGDRKG